jgi:hypothetical protein
MGSQDRAGDAQHLHRRQGLLSGSGSRHAGRMTMFEKLGRMWNGLGTMDIALAVTGFVTAGAIYAAFLL